MAANKLTRVIIGALLALIAAGAWGCGGTSLTPVNTTQRTRTPAFKGMELYSWQNQNGDWYFSLLPGTNRNKNAEEIRAVPLSLSQLKDQIARLAVEEDVYWLDAAREDNGSYEALPLPPAVMVSGLQDYAALLDVTITTIRLSPQSPN